MKLHIDTWNVIYTLYAYLLGLPVYLADDGILRDAVEAHTLPQNDDKLSKAVEMLIEHLKAEGPEEVIFYLDEKMGGEEKITAIIRTCSGDHLRKVSMVFSEQVDQFLAGISDGLIATSDSQVIDRTGAGIADLPRAVLRRNFHPAFPDLREI